MYWFLCLALATFGSHVVTSPVASARLRWPLRDFVSVFREEMVHRPASWQNPHYFLLGTIIARIMFFLFVFQSETGQTIWHFVYFGAHALVFPQYLLTLWFLDDSMLAALNDVGFNGQRFIRRLAQRVARKWAKAQEAELTAVGLPKALCELALQFRLDKKIINKKRVC
jgi:hypothetical protein